MALRYGITDVPLTYDPPVKDASELKIVQQEKADAPISCAAISQAEPARQLPNLQKMPVLVVTAEASYHAPYDHCTVNYLRQAGVAPHWLKLAEHGIRGNSHVLMMEKNSKRDRRSHHRLDEQDGRAMKTYRRLGAPPVGN